MLFVMIGFIALSGCSFLAKSEDNSDDLAMGLGLALIFSGGQSVGDGDQRILAAGILALQDPFRNVTNESTQNVTPQDLSSQDYFTYRCTTADINESVIREISDSVALQTGFDSIYPGAIIQGRGLLNGNFTPVTIPRAGGTIYMTGLKLSQGSSYYKNLPTISPSTVKQAIEDTIVSENVQGTAAEASYSLVQVYDESHLYFELGLDARYKVAQISGNFQFTQNSKKNFILMKFTQKYYDVIFEDPELSTSVFRDGRNFQDPEQQIFPGNPPLYVSKVSFGRQVFFLMETEFTKTDIEAAVSAAYNKGIGSIETSLRTRYERIFSKTKINYVVFGGDAGLALAPIASAEPMEMFSKVAEFLANPDAANFSARNPGVPIAYSLRYLTNRVPARMSFTTNTRQNQCNRTDRASSIAMYFHHIDDTADIYFKGARLDLRNSSSAKEFSIKPQVTEMGTAHAVFEVQLYNSSGNNSPAGLRMDIQVNGSPASQCSVNRSNNSAKNGLVYAVIYHIRADGDCILARENHSWN